MANDLYDLLLRKQAFLVMQIEVLDYSPNIDARKEAIEQKKFIKKKRLHMKVHIKGSA